MRDRPGWTDVFGPCLPAFTADSVIRLRDEMERVNYIHDIQVDEADRLVALIQKAIAEHPFGADFARKITVSSLLGWGYI